MGDLSDRVRLLCLSQVWIKVGDLSVWIKVGDLSDRASTDQSRFVTKTLLGRAREPTPFSSGVYICKSIVNHLRHGNYICKSEGNYLTYEHRIEIPVEFTYVNK